MILTLILLAIGGTILFMAVRSLRAQRLKERYVLLFVFVGVPFIILGAWPGAVGAIARRLDIEYHTVLLLGITTFFLLTTFKLLSIVSLQEQRLAAVAQMMGVITSRRKTAEPLAAGDSGTTPSDPDAASK